MARRAFERQTTTGLNRSFRRPSTLSIKISEIDGVEVVITDIIPNWNAIRWIQNKMNVAR
jgi:hypothetical protein